MIAGGLVKSASGLLKRDWYIWLMIVAAFLLGVIFYPHLPLKMPVHWDSSGHINGYSSREVGAFSMPCIATVVYLLFCVIPLIDPRARNYDKFKSSYQMIKGMTITIFLVVQICTILTGLGVKIDVSVIIGVAISVLFILLGNVMGRFRHNYFVGIRTPWTLASEEVWRKTHRLAGPVWVLGGFINLALTLFSGRMVVVGTLLVAAAMVLLPCIYSYVVFRLIGGEKR